MTAVTNLLASSQARGHLRSFDARRDLSQVADLVEQCFSDTLDPDGLSYLARMRSAARNAGFLQWALSTSGRVPIPLSGYVWEQDGRIVGNLTLIPFSLQNGRAYLIANVAVKPEFRRQGIARSLTTTAIEHAQKRGARAVWLHVRAENEAAVRLYRDLGFIERARRDTWVSDSGPLVDGGGSSWNPDITRVTIEPRRRAHWPAQSAWLLQAYPQELTWHLPLRLSALQPGIFAAIQRLSLGMTTWQWSAMRGEKLLGTLACQLSTTYADSLWLAAGETMEAEAAHTLLRHVRLHFPARRPLSLDYPHGRVADAIREAGFHLHQTLVWMNIIFS